MQRGLPEVLQYLLIDQRQIHNRRVTVIKVGTWELFEVLLDHLRLDLSLINRSRKTHTKTFHSFQSVDKHNTRSVCRASGLVLTGHSEVRSKDGLPMTRARSRLPGGWGHVQYHELC